MITEQERLERRKRIGSSDVGPILGLSPYDTAYNVWLEKTGQLEQEPASDPADAGNYLEGGVLDNAEVKLGALERATRIEAVGLPFPLASNLDARVIQTGRPVEAKTAGLFGPLSTDWDDDAIDGVPDTYIAQCQVHLLVTKTDLCHLPALLGGKGFCMFEIPRNEEFIKIMIDRCAAFWQHVETRKPPENILPTLEAVKRVRRQPNKIIDIPPALITDWRIAKDAMNQAKALVEVAETSLLTALGDAEGGRSNAGNVTYFKSDRAGYVVKPTEYRTLRFRKKPL